MAENYLGTYAKEQGYTDAANTLTSKGLAETASSYTVNDANIYQIDGTLDPDTFTTVITNDNGELDDDGTNKTTVALRKNSITGENGYGIVTSSSSAGVAIDGAALATGLKSVVQATLKKLGLTQDPNDTDTANSTLDNIVTQTREQLNLKKDKIIGRVDPPSTDELIAEKIWYKNPMGRTIWQIVNDLGLLKTGTFTPEYLPDVTEATNFRITSMNSNLSGDMLISMIEGYTGRTVSDAAATVIKSVFDVSVGSEPLKPGEVQYYMHFPSDYEAGTVQYRPGAIVSLFPTSTSGTAFIIPLYSNGGEVNFNYIGQNSNITFHPSSHSYNLAGNNATLSDGAAIGVFPATCSAAEDGSYGTTGGVYGISITYDADTISAASVYLTYGNMNRYTVIGRGLAYNAYSGYGWSTLYGTWSGGTLGYIHTGTTTGTADGDLGISDGDTEYSADISGIDPADIYTPASTSDVTGGQTDVPTVPIIPSDNVDTISLPTDVIFNGLCLIYHLTRAQLYNLGAFLWSADFLDQVQKIMFSPLDAVIKCYEFYGNPRIGGNIAALVIGNTTVSTISPDICYRYATVDCGRITIPRVYDNALDYKYTTLTLFLPFIGFVELNTQDFMNGYMAIEYAVDLMSGMCVANVLCQNGRTKSIIGAYTGNCAVEIPLSATDARNLYLGTANALLGFSTSAAGMAAAKEGITAAGNTGNVLGAAGQMFGGLSGAETIHMSGQAQGNAGALTYKKPYVIIRRADGYNPESYADIGFPSNSIANVSAVSGHVTMTNMTITGPMTADEKQEIERLFSSGVIV